jgi:hypothetical protein
MYLALDLSAVVQDDENDPTALREHGDVGQHRDGSDRLHRCAQGLGLLSR